MFSMHYVFTLSQDYLCEFLLIIFFSPHWTLKKELKKK